MKPIFLFSLIICLSACSSKASNKKETQATVDSTVVLQTEDSLFSEDDFEIDAYATYYIVVADTNTDYYFLQKKMYVLSKQLKIEIDTMGRFYNAKKNLIALPDDDEDEMYAGDYFPRRYPTETLSLEYLDFYTIHDSSEFKLIALVSGIYETEQSADSALAVLRSTEKDAFKIETEMYIGCMH